MAAEEAQTQQNAAQPSALLDDVPDSLWESIIALLKPRQKAQLRATCRKLRQLVNNSVLKIKLDPTYSEDALSWQLHRRFPHLTHLELIKPSEVDCFTDQTFAQLALKDLAHMPHLASLNLENCTQLSVAGMAAIALPCTKLKSLTVPQVCQLCMSDSMLMVLGKLPELSKLRVQCCKHCDEVTLSHLSDLRKLTALELEDYGQALRQVTQLTSLTNLQSVMVWSDFSYDVSEMMHGLGLPNGGMHGGHGFDGGHFAQQHQPIDPTNPIMAAAAAAMANMHLVGGGGGMAAGGAVNMQAAAWAIDGGNNEELAHQLQLTEQVLSNIAEGKSALLGWVSGMTQLTHVDIQRVDIDSEDLRRLSALPGLKHLGVGDLNMATEPVRPLAAVTKLVSHNIQNESFLRGTFPALKALSCDAADSGLLEIAELRNLANLFLWNSPSDAITDKGLASLSGLAALDTFRLEGTDAVTDAGWGKFTDSHTSLTRIDLVKCPNITDVGFILSIKQLPRLTRISFTECPGIDAPTLAALLAFCTRLEHVELQDCPSISQANIRGLLNSIYRPDLDVVYRKSGAMRLIYC